MRIALLVGALGAMMLVSAPLRASDAANFDNGSAADQAPYLQCVPYARMLSGIAIYGDAHTWWGQAEGRFARGSVPRQGAVMSFRPHGNMRLGHVAAVSRVIDSRTLLLSHANWSVINGRRGQIEDNVRAIDVSPGNDWSQVRVWHAPTQSLGTTAWPVNGFIYKNGAPTSRPVDSRTSDIRIAANTARPSLPGLPPRQAASNDPIGEIIARRAGRAGRSGRMAAR